jgi:hypothetical protein
MYQFVIFDSTVLGNRIHCLMMTMNHVVGAHEDFGYDCDYGVTLNQTRRDERPFLLFVPLSVPSSAPCVRVLQLFQPCVDRLRIRRPFRPRWD